MFWRMFLKINFESKRIVFYQHAPVMVPREPARSVSGFCFEKADLITRPWFSGPLQSVSVVEHAFKLLVLSQWQYLPCDYCVWESDLYTNRLQSLSVPAANLQEKLTDFLPKLLDCSTEIKSFHDPPKLPSYSTLELCERFSCIMAALCRVTNEGRWAWGWGGLTPLPCPTCPVMGTSMDLF